MTQSNNTTCRRTSFGLTLLLPALWNAGCSLLPSHLHNEANAKIALQAQIQMVEYAKNAPAMYTAMLANVEKFRIEEEFLLTELATNFHTSVITKLPTLTWKAFRDRVKHNQTAVAEFKEQIRMETEAYLKGRGETLANLKTADEAVAAATKSVQSAKQQVAAWNAYVALLQQGFANLPDNLADLKKDAGLKTLNQAVSGVGKQEITFTDADGKTAKSSVAAILKDRLSSITVDKESQAAASLLPDAPGIGLIIMNLGLGLAEIEQERAQIRLAQLSARAVLFEDALAAMQVADRLLIEVDGETNSFNPPETAFSDIAASWQEATTKFRDDPVNFIIRQNSISGSVLVLRKLATAESIVARNQSLFKVAVARLEHQDSIANSAVGDAAWQVLIQSGVDGLAAYHQGGFTREDAANVIRIAQTIALGFIATGTN